jgi:hypothetical protein
MSDSPQRYVARFSDGKTASSRDARVQLGAVGILIEPADGGRGLTWSYDGLTAADPLTTHSIDALLNHSSQPGAALFVPDKGFALALAELSPHLTARAQRMRAARPWLWTAAIAALVAGGIWVADLSPGRTIARLLPDTTRKSLGDQVVAAMTRGRGSCVAPAGLAALSKLTERLSTAAQTKQTFKVVVVDWNIINAFATPGERIVLTRALLRSHPQTEERRKIVAAIPPYAATPALSDNDWTALLRVCMVIEGAADAPRESPPPRA